VPLGSIRWTEPPGECLEQCVRAAAELLERRGREIAALVVEPLV